MASVSEARPTYALGVIREVYSSAPFNNPGDRVYAAIKDRGLPTALDTTLLQLFPVRNQEKQGSCVAFGASTVANNVQHYGPMKLNEWSAPQYIYNLRKDPSQEGMMLSDAQTILKTYGIVKETQFPYGEAIGGKETVPSDLIFQGQKYKMTDFASLTSLTDLKAAMVHNQAGVMMIFDVYNFDADFWVQHSGESVIGGHCVTAVGYDDNKQMIKIQNSWGTDWADNGFTNYPYDAFNKHVQHAAMSFVSLDNPSVPSNVNDYSRCAIL